MPPKIRELVAELERAGFSDRGKGSHRNFVLVKYFVQSIVSLLLTLTIALSGANASDVMVPGEYVRSRDSGWLKVERLNSKTLFSIESIGGNCHSCGVSGTVVGTLGQAEDEPSSNAEVACRIRMTPSRGAMKVEVEPLTDEACRQYCGMRAGFDGIYRKPQQLCTKAGQRKVRDLFIRHYRARQFPQAVAALLPILEQCGEFLNWIEVDRVRNDLSLAYFHGGSTEQCSKTLRETTASSYPDEEALRGGLPPCDFDNYLPTARATWHNMRVCGAQPDQQR